MGGIVTAPAGGSGSGILGSIITGVTAIANIVDTGIFKKIRDNAKRKKAQGIANAGGYNSLSDYQKSLIPVPAMYETVNNTTPVSLFDGIPATTLLGAGLLLLALLLAIFRKKIK